MANNLTERAGDTAPVRSGWWELDVAGLREASWFTLTVVIIAAAAAVTLFNLYVDAVLATFQPIYDATAELVQTTLLVNVLLLVAWPLLVKRVGSSGR